MAVQPGPQNGCIHGFMEDVIEKGQGESTLWIANYLYTRLLPFTYTSRALQLRSMEIYIAGWSGGDPLTPFQAQLVAAIRQARSQLVPDDVAASFADSEDPGCTEAGTFIDPAARQVAAMTTLPPTVIVMPAGSKGAPWGWIVGGVVVAGALAMVLGTAPRRRAAT